MKNTIYVFTLLFVAFFISCEEEEGIQTADLNYINFASPNYSAGVDPGSSASVDITVYTTTISNSDRSFGLSVDTANSNAAAGSYTVPESVVVPAGTNEGSFTVNLTDTNLGIGINEIIINISPEVGLYNNEGTSVSYTQNCTELNGSLDFIFDFYAGETEWEILNSEGGLTVAGGPYSNGDDPVSEPIVLCQGRSYTLVIYDSYGDGFCCFYGDGSYSLTVDGNEISAGDGDIGSELRVDFSL